MSSKRKKLIKLSSFIFVLFTVLLTSLFFVNKFLIKKNTNNDLINISDLSEEFMDNYFEEIAEIDEDDKENILIVTSKEKIVNTYGATNVIEGPNHQYFLQYNSTEEKSQALNKFKENDSIINVDENQIVTFSEVNHNSWGIKKMALDSATGIANENELNDVTVAIIDTGCDIELINKYYSGKISETYNVLTSSTNSMNDTNGHGTHIAGTIAEGTPSNVKIIPIKVATGSTQRVVDIITAINYIVGYEKADVINMSFGLYGYNSALYNAIESANSKNIVSIAAAGNDNTSSEHYPAAFDNTISIASVDSELKKSSFSNYGSTITFTAPGTDIKSIMSKDMEISQKNGNVDNDNDHETISGTSMATPHAVSAVAILKSYNKNLTMDNVVDLLKNYATLDLGTPGKDTYYGYGFISFNSDSFCVNSEEDVCEKFGVFKSSSKIGISEIKVENVVRTSYNYGTVNNFNPTELKVSYSNGMSATEVLGNLSGVEIIGYDPYDTQEQTVTIRWQGHETSFDFTNPSDWQSGWSYNNITDETIQIIDFLDFNYGYATKKLYIPEKIDGYDVVSIINAFGGLFTKSSYEEIILPSTLTEIAGTMTFADFSSVEKITMLSDSVKITGDYAFQDNTSLVEIDGIIEMLGKESFANNISLQKITLSDDITEIPKNTFYKCRSLNNIDLPKNLKIIDEGAFYNAGLTQIILPDNVETIGDHSFSGCVSLNNISLSKNTKTIGEHAFYNTGLTQISLPDSVETLGSYAFYTNKTLEHIDLSQNLKSIGDFSLAGTSITEINLPDSLETIGKNAFAGTNISSFHLPKNVTSIGSSLLLYCDKLKALTVDEDNAVYDSRNNSNAIIETATDILIYGISTTIIPEDVKMIGISAFNSVKGIKELTIPDSVTTIGKTAFYGSSLEKVYIPSSVETIGEDAFIGQDESYITIWVNSNSYSIIYALENEIPYETVDYPYFSTSLENYNFNAFDKFEADIYLYFNRGMYVGTNYKEFTGTQGRKEIIKYDELDVIYPNNGDSFRYGDTSIIIRGTTQYGDKFEKTFNVTISKIKPSYEVPTDLTADVGQKLSDVILPDNFEWIDGDILLENNGHQIFKAKYVPEDTTNYETVENIDINIAVGDCKTILTPTISIIDKTYDGTKTIEIDTITVSGLEKNDYTIVSAELSSENVGTTTAKVKLKLSDEKFRNYSFDDGSQEKEFTVDVNIIAKKISKPTLVEKSYTFNGNEQIIELNNFDKSTMNISGNTRTNAGEQDVTISLKNSNYVWNDNTTDDVILKFTINKADSNIVYTASDNTVIYDGNFHGISLNVESPNNAIIKYANSNGEYILDEMPKYTNIGEYVIKFRIYIDDNYTDILGEKILKIINNTIINNSTDYEGFYDGEEHAFNLDIEPSDYTIKYSINNTDYNLTELPKLKDVGEYTINYKISAPGYDDLIGSNKVKIYGIKNFDSTVSLRNNIILVKNNSFSNISNKIFTYANSTLYSHYDKNNTLITSDITKTGDIIKINLNNLKDYQYYISVMGDVNGDGKISSADYVKIKKHIMQTEIIKDNIYFYSADINKDNKILSADYVKIRKYIMNGESL